MGTTEKTVFLSYRRKDFSWAQLLFRELQSSGYDVFFDFDGAGSGDFASRILGNVRARAHFLLLLTPTALERCGEPGDWLRQEVECALAAQRNIVPLLLEGCSFDQPQVTSYLTGGLAVLKSYQGLTVPKEYFSAAMERLREKYLDVPLDTVLHPVSAQVRRQTEDEQKRIRAATGQPAPASLTAGDWLLQGDKIWNGQQNPREAEKCFTESLRLDANDAVAWDYRGYVRYSLNDLSGALSDYNEAIRLAPAVYESRYIRGKILNKLGNHRAALIDLDVAVKLKPDNAWTYWDRMETRAALGDRKGARKDLDIHEQLRRPARS